MYQMYNQLHMRILVGCLWIPTIPTTLTKNQQWWGVISVCVSVLWSCILPTTLMEQLFDGILLVVEDQSSHVIVVLIITRWL